MVTPLLVAVKKKKAVCLQLGVQATCLQVLYDHSCRGAGKPKRLFDSSVRVFIQMLGGCDSLAPLYLESLQAPEAKDAAVTCTPGATMCVLRHVCAGSPELAARKEALLGIYCTRVLSANGVLPPIEHLCWTPLLAVLTTADVESTVLPVLPRVLKRGPARVPALIAHMIESLPPSSCDVCAGLTGVLAETLVEHARAGEDSPLCVGACSVARAMAKAYGTGDAYGTPAYPPSPGAAPWQPPGTAWCSPLVSRLNKQTNSTRHPVSLSLPPQHPQAGVCFVACL